MKNKKNFLGLLITLLLVVFAFICGSTMPSQRTKNEIISESQVTVNEVQNSNINIVKEEQSKNAININITSELSHIPNNVQDANVPDAPDTTGNKTKQELEHEVSSLSNYLLNQDENGNAIHPCLTINQVDFYTQQLNDACKELDEIEVVERVEELEKEIESIQNYLDGYDANGQRTHPSLTDNSADLDRLREALNELEKLREKIH